MYIYRNMNQQNYQGHGHEEIKDNMNWGYGNNSMAGILMNEHMHNSDYHHGMQMSNLQLPTLSQIDGIKDYNYGYPSQRKE